jgi:hypothetical protein
LALPLYTASPEQKNSVHAHLGFAKRKAPLVSQQGFSIDFPQARYYSLRPVLPPTEFVWIPLYKKSHRQLSYHPKAI